MSRVLAAAGGFLTGLGFTTLLTTSNPIMGLVGGAGLVISCYNFWVVNPKENEA